jgi:hypothetical protein
MATIDYSKPLDLPNFDHRILDLTGKKFERLLVVSFAGRTKHNKIAWNCICDCGTKTINTSNKLIGNDGPKSCGCFRRERSKQQTTIHGNSYVPGYKCWKDMIDRCHNKNCSAYEYYGYRGIAVCDRWRCSFENFLQDMGMRPDNHSIERINNDGNYEPENCRWATMKEQASNRRKAKPRAKIVIEFNGMQKTIPEWSEYLNVPVGTIWCRRSRGYSVEQVLSCGKILSNKRK